ncbi:TonB-dependent receptor domain-containing protein [Acidovorax sp.]|uniref:TonB-dependent receptor domain-containing protein n=1 Tax=Acidovorax sp. TaxID=1872122 RepID=UPI003D040C4D
MCTEGGACVRTRALQPCVDAFGQSINVDEAVTRLELSTRIPSNKAWSATANYTYMKSEQKSGPNVGNTLMDTPEHALNARLNWEPSRQWNVWLRAEYRSERFRDPGTTADTRAAKAALGDFKAYTQFHVGAATRSRRSSRSMRRCTTCSTRILWTTRRIRCRGRLR